MSLPFNPIALPPFNHNDDVHVDSAKRGVAEGVAGLDINGNIYNKAANPFVVVAANAIAAGGEIILESADYLTYKNDITIDRNRNSIRVFRNGDTSGRVILDLSLDGLNEDSLEYNLSDLRKNTASGIAGLDYNARINIKQTPAILEEYFNHNGVIDNFLTKTESLGGTITENASLHRFDFSSGVFDTPTATLKTKSSFDTLDTLIFKFTLSAYTGFSDSTKIQIGLKADTDVLTRELCAMIEISNGSVTPVLADFAAITGTVRAFSSNQTYEILINDDIANLYIDGILRETSTTNIPMGLLTPFCTIFNSEDDVAGETIVSLDNIAIKRIEGL